MTIDKNALANMLKKRLKEPDASGGDNQNPLIRSDWFEKGITYTTSRTVFPPETILEVQRILASQDSGTVKDAYDFLRTKVLSRLQAMGGNVLGITSSGTGEGKTLTAINLAISISKKMDRTVLLVDADLAHPMIHQYFGLDLKEGLVDYLAKDVPIEQLLVNPGIERLVLLPGGVAEERGLEFLTSPKMLSLVKELKIRYQSRLVIFDLPPILNTANTMAFSPLLDGILLVVKAGTTQREDVEKALSLIKGTPVIGTVLNQV